MESGSETNRLRQEIERALRRAFDPADVLPRLARLSRIAPPGSDDGIFAHRQLAELLVERYPWRAAIHAKKALAHRPSDDRAWAVLAFCQTLLGNFRCAAAAYKQAVACAPGNPWYAHNLGHLLDVALGLPDRAVPWLKVAYGSKSDNSEIVASYAHALGRAGKTAEARSVLERALSRFDSRELAALLRWLDQGAPSRPRPRGGRAAKRASANRSAAAVHGAPAAPMSSANATNGANGTRRATTKRAGAPLRRSKEGWDGRLARVLARGLSHLPLDPKQRERALALARDAVPFAGQPAPPASAALVASLPPREDVAGLAAAVAYAIVYVDHVPLSQAEVAAPFRVAVGRLRGRFAELRARLDLIRGDARYATTHR